MQTNQDPTEGQNSENQKAESALHDATCSDSSIRVLAKMRNKSPTRPPRWKWEKRLWRFEIDVSRFINTQCLSLSICINWNFRPGIEMDLLLWRVNIEYCPLRG